MHGREAFEFRGTKRFEVRRRIGAGGMGIVYEAFDRDQGTVVALKTLRHLDPQTLFRLKNEFRALQDLHHPNLISLGELIEEGGQWFFTMELVHGVDFLEYVKRDEDASPAVLHNTAPAAPIARERMQQAETGAAYTPPPPAPPSAASREPRFDEKRLRRALVGLAQGVYALHDANMVHRDIKPSNILVTRDGRAVVLDFGLVTESTMGHSSESQVVGTAAYMAPEQAAAKRAGPAADWHSVGVVLYEALTGRLPFTGSSLEILMDKQMHDPPPPRVHVDGVPEDLDSLCTELLRFDPKARPTGREVLKRLGADEPLETARTSTSQGTGNQPFVGRDSELEVLGQAFAASRQGKQVTVYVHGESGVGKSSLIRTATRRIEAECPDAVILTGRCYERESVHYKAFDGVIDQLSQYMRKLPDREVGTLLPRNAALLSRVFPVLGRVEVIAQAPQPRHDVKDLRELRSRVFTALGELLARLAERHPLVITIDDLHWADADSSVLLAELLRDGQLAPALLLISSREPIEPSPPIPGDVRRLALRALDPESARQLARVLLRRASLRSEVSPAEIAVDARGNPLFIDQLVRYAAAGGRAPGQDAATHLEEVILERVAGLPAPATFVLELVCVAGRPLYQSSFALAARMEPTEITRHVALLRVANLVRGRRDGDFETLEPYHDRVREAILEHLTEEQRRKRHQRLAFALDSAGATRHYPQLVMTHFEAAGDLDKACDCAIDAAERAANALAFDRATDFYRTALRLSDPHSDRAVEIRTKLGEALVNLGLGAEAAESFMEVASGAEPRVRIEYHRRAAEQLLTSGYYERGLEVLRELLAEVGTELPDTPRKALRSLVWSRIKLRLRGLEWRERAPEEIADRELLRIDVYKTAAHGMAMVDAVRSADFQARGLLLALETGEPTRVGVFLATEAIHVASQGTKSLPRARALLDAARRIGQTAGNHYLNTWTVLARGFLRYFENRFASAAELLHEVEHKILDEAKGMAWELSSCRLCRLWALRQMGAFADMRRAYDEYLEDAVQRGDRYAETSMRYVGSVVWLVADDPDRAQREIEAATWTSPDGSFHLQHWWYIEAAGELALYRRDAARGLDDLAPKLRAMKASLLTRLETVRLNGTWMEARLLAARALERPENAAADRRAAGKLARSMKRIGTPYARVLADLIEAALLVQAAPTGAPPAGALARLREVSDLSAQHDLLLYGLVARRREGELVGGSAGAALIESTDRLLRETGVVAPGRVCDVVAPGFGRG